VTWFGYLGATLTHDNGDLVLTTPTQLAPGFSLGAAIVLKDGLPMAGADISAQAVVRVSDPSTFASISTRAQAGPPDGDGGAYVGILFGNGELRAEYFGLGFKSLQTDLDATASDVVLQFKSIGGDLTTTAWAVNDPDKKFEINWPDAPLRPPGAFGIGFGSLEDTAGGGSVTVADAVSATFRSYQVTHVPDGGSTLALFVAGFGAMPLLRRFISR
jgi:hypothetical protein